MRLIMPPFVLLGRKKLAPESAPSPEHVYDSQRQLWIDQISGMPLVSCMQAHTHPSTYGETTMTETREGADQSEGAAFQASPFGETTVTKTSKGADRTEITALFRASQFGESTHTATQEGVDRPERATFQTSQFGETTLTRTREGADQTEDTSLEGSQFGETTLTNTQEGADLTEAIAPLVFNAPYSHF